MRMMSDMLTHIASHVPSFDAMFPEEQPLQEEGEEIEKPPAQGQHVEEERMPVQDAESPSVVKQQETRGNMQETEKKGNILGSGLQKMKAWKKGNRKKRKHIPDFVEELLEDGYSSEQLGYILDCMEDGADPEEIKRFASPKLPVELMRRLRMMEKKEETGNGK